MDRHIESLSDIKNKLKKTKAIKCPSGDLDVTMSLLEGELVESALETSLQKTVHTHSCMC